jgi:DNA invertase Pin-like site-specific DNA recombinase
VRSSAAKRRPFIAATHNPGNSRRTVRQTAGGRYSARRPLCRPGVSGARTSRPNFDRALDTIHEGDTLLIATLNPLGRSTQNMLSFADDLRARGAGLRVLNLGGRDVDTSTPMASMLFTIMAALAQMDFEIKRERITDSVSNRRAAGGDLGGRPQKVTDRQIRNALHLIDSGKATAQVLRDLGKSRSTFYRRAQTLKF